MARRGRLVRVLEHTTAIVCAASLFSAVLGVSMLLVGYLVVGLDPRVDQDAINRLAEYNRSVEDWNKVAFQEKYLWPFSNLTVSVSLNNEKNFSSPTNLQAKSDADDVLCLFSDHDVTEYDHFKFESENVDWGIYEWKDIYKKKVTLLFGFTNEGGQTTQKPLSTHLVMKESVVVDQTLKDASNILSVTTSNGERRLVKKDTKALYRTAGKRYLEDSYSQREGSVEFEGSEAAEATSTLNDAKACDEISGWFNETSGYCELYYALSHFWVKMSCKKGTECDPTNWEWDKTYGGYGCTPDSANMELCVESAHPEVLDNGWDPAVYMLLRPPKGGGPPTKVNLNGLDFVVRLHGDPYVVAAKLTDGTMDFDFPKGETNTLGYFLVFLGWPFSLLPFSFFFCFLGCKFWFKSKTKKNYTRMQTIEVPVTIPHSARPSPVVSTGTAPRSYVGRERDDDLESVYSEIESTRSAATSSRGEMRAPPKVSVHARNPRATAKQSKQANGFIQHPQLRKSTTEHGVGENGTAGVPGTLGVAGMGVSGSGASRRMLVPGNRRPVPPGGHPRRKASMNTLPVPGGAAESLEQSVAKSGSPNRPAVVWGAGNRRSVSNVEVVNGRANQQGGTESSDEGIVSDTQAFNA